MALKNNTSRIGIIGRSDLGGLGIETRAFVKHIPSKVMLVKVGNYRHFPEHFKNQTVINGFPTDSDIAEFIKDIDVLFCLETPYNENTFRICREKGVRSVLRINYEWLPRLNAEPDLYINPVDWYMDNCPKNTIHFPYPVDRKLHKFKLREKAKTFLHIVGHGGGYGRNGTKELLEAIPMIKSDVKFIIHSQIEIDMIDDPRIEWRIGNYDDESKMYDADVLLYPRKYAGQSLPMNEAMSHGLAIMMTDMLPQNKILPKELLIPIKSKTEIMIARKIEMGFVDPKDIAIKVDEIANTDITKYSKLSDEYAESISWHKNLANFCLTLTNMV